jgi:hypothetical protein
MSRMKKYLTWGHPAIDETITVEWSGRPNDTVPPETLEKIRVFLEKHKEKIAAWLDKQEPRE